ncbi:MAG: hypothetical protein K5892_03080 [Acholeplasmatales bacterium]|nr:hypothetical protein [Acholeplasmatales bacterium]
MNYIDFLRDKKYDELKLVLEDELTKNPENGNLWYLLFLCTNNNFYDFNPNKINDYRDSFFKSILYSSLEEKMKIFVDIQLYTYIIPFYGFGNIIRKYQMKQYVECIDDLIVHVNDEKVSANYTKVSEALEVIFEKATDVAELNLQIIILNALYLKSSSNIFLGMLQKKFANPLFQFSNIGFMTQCMHAVELKSYLVHKHLLVSNEEDKESIARVIDSIKDQKDFEIQPKLTQKSDYNPQVIKDYSKRLREGKYDNLAEDIRNDLKVNPYEWILWYLLFLSENRNYLNFNPKKVVDIESFNNAKKFSSKEIELIIDAEYRLFSNTYNYSVFVQMFRYYQYRKYEQCLVQLIMFLNDKSNRVTNPKMIFNALSILFKSPSCVTDLNFQILIINALYLKLNYQEFEKLFLLKIQDPMYNYSKIDLITLAKDSKELMKYMAYDTIINLDDIRNIEEEKNTYDPHSKNYEPDKSNLNPNNVYGTRIGLSRPTYGIGYGIVDLVDIISHILLR